MKFTITPDHIKLLGKSYYKCGYYGSVEQDPKRPYGNKDVVGDLWRILRSPDGETYWDWDEQEEMPEELRNELLQIHQQMALVVQILVVATAEDFPFRAGLRYRLSEVYDTTSWVPDLEELAK